MAGPLSAALDVAWATDAAYAPFAAASIHSVLVAEPDAVAHLLLAPDVDARDERRFAELGAGLDGRIRLHRFDDVDVRRLPTMPEIPAVMWYRIHLPRLLPDATRVLYLDADTVARTSVRPLFEIDLGGCLVGAVDNVTEPGRRDLAAELGIPPHQRYFNSGVLVMDLDGMRREGAMDAVAATAVDRILVWPDQDALNVALGHRRHALHPRWNAQNSIFGWTAWAEEVFGRERVGDVVRDPAILHFEGHGPGTKPWDDRCRHPYRGDYLAHAAATPWRRTPDVMVRAGRVGRRALRRVMARSGRRT